MEGREMGTLVRGYRVGGEALAETLKRKIKNSFPELLVQASDAEAASNERFLEMICAQTAEASSSGSPLARRPEVDLLLRLAGTTQIAEAIKGAGTKRGKPFLMVVAGKEKDITRLESSEATNWERLPRRPLTREELGRIELAALLDAERA